MYVHDIEVGTTVLEGKPEVMNETSATALVDGNNLLGPVSGYLSNRPHFLWVYRRDNPRRMLGEHSKSL